MGGWILAALGVVGGGLAWLAKNARHACGDDPKACAVILASQAGA